MKHFELMKDKLTLLLVTFITNIDKSFLFIYLKCKGGKKHYLEKINELAAVRVKVLRLTK